MTGTLPAQSERALDRVNASVRQLSRDMETNFAPLESPAFTGAPTAPTPDGASDDTSIATTEFVVDRLAGPAASLAAHEARTDNPHATTKAQVGLGNADNTSDASKPVSTAQQAALDLKANLASPALTGTPTAPTAGVGASTTQLATTAFVVNEIEARRDWRAVRKTADQAIANTAAFVDDSELSFPVVAGGVYSFRVALFISNGLGGYSNAINGPAASSVRVSANTTGTVAGYSAYNVSIFGIAGGSSKIVAEVLGTLKPTADGAVVIRHAQVSSNAAATYVEAGSVLDYVRVA